MTTVIKQCLNDNYYISLEINKSYNKHHYTVSAYPIIDRENRLCGYPVREMTYSLNDKRNAFNTYNRYIKKYI